MNKFMKIAIEEAEIGIKKGDGGPFGCVIVKGGVIVGRGHNQVVKQKDPTCHGEMMAIRDACKNLGSFDLSGCKLYTTGKPCPMCFGAILWANISEVFYGCSTSDAEILGFRDDDFYRSSDKFRKRLFVETDRSECLELYKRHSELKNKTEY